VGELIWETIRPFIRNEVLLPTYDYFPERDGVTEEELLEGIPEGRKVPRGCLRFTMPRSIFIRALDKDNPVLLGSAEALYQAGQQPSTPLFTIRSFHLFK